MSLTINYFIINRVQLNCDTCTEFPPNLKNTLNKGINLESNVNTNSLYCW